MIKILEFDNVTDLIGITYLDHERRIMQFNSNMPISIDGGNGSAKLIIGSESESENLPKFVQLRLVKKNGK